MQYSITIKAEKREVKMIVLLKSYRGNIADLYTSGSIVVVDNKGNIIYSAGDPDEIAFPRSSAKLMQALVPLSLGAKEKFGLMPQEISQICASHSGEDFHIETVKGILHKIGLDESYLKCGAHYPFKSEIELRMKINNEKPRDIHNNCSGKHSGMLMASILMNASTDDYYRLEHPVQKKITAMIEKICDYTIPEKNISVDGCGVPVHSLPLYNYAFGMARFADYENLPDGLSVYAKDIIDAITAHSEYMSGTDRIDHLLIKKYPGRIIVKSGANGYFGGLLPDKKYGIAIKMYNGDSNNRNIVLIHLLKKLNIIPEADYAYFDGIADKTIRNHRGEKAGEVVPQF